MTAAETFLAWAVPLAQAEARRTGIPAHLTLAQGIVESASGTSILATKGNNFFGIKGDYLGKRLSKTPVRSITDKRCESMQHSVLIRIG